MDKYRKIIKNLMSPDDNIKLTTEQEWEEFERLSDELKRMTLIDTRKEKIRKIRNV
jgi:hypothetical protein